MEKQKPEITMQPVKSSNIGSCGHCAKTSTLAVQFKNGTYHYAGVGVEDFKALLAAKSVGKYFMAHIRGQFESVKV